MDALIARSHAADAARAPPTGRHPFFPRRRDGRLIGCVLGAFLCFSRLSLTLSLSHCPSAPRKSRRIGLFRVDMRALDQQPGRPRCHETDGRLFEYRDVRAAIKSPCPAAANGEKTRDPYAPHARRLLRGTSVRHSAADRNVQRSPPSATGPEEPHAARKGAVITSSAASTLFNDRPGNRYATGGYLLNGILKHSMNIESAPGRADGASGDGNARLAVSLTSLA